MRLKTYYTIGTSLLLLLNKDNFKSGSTKLNILLSKETDFAPLLYSILDKLENEYIISINASLLQDRGFLPGLLSKVYILLALNKSTTGQKIIPIFSEARYQNESLNIEEFQTYLNHQGLHKIQFPIFDYSANGIQTIDNCSLFVMQEKAAGLPNAPSENNDYASTMIIAFRKEISDFAIISDLKNHISSEERTHILKPDIFQFYITKDEFELEMELWKKRTLLYQDFLSLSKKIQEKEYYDVLNWYRNEYEILPRWYKRLGHILKVLMGKRTFKSLFDKNAPKYKE